MAPFNHQLTTTGLSTAIPFKELHEILPPKGEKSEERNATQAKENEKDTERGRRTNLRNVQKRKKHGQQNTLRLSQGRQRS